MNLTLESLTVLALSVSASAAQIGSVVRAQKLNEVSGGIVGPIPLLGYSLAAIGDLNGDGVGDLVAGLPFDRSAGVDHGAKAAKKIAQGSAGFTGELHRQSNFGNSLARLGDVNGDGFVDLSATEPSDGHRWVLSTSTRT